MFFSKPATPLDGMYQQVRPLLNYYMKNTQYPSVDLPCLIPKEGAWASKHMAYMVTGLCSNELSQTVSSTQGSSGNLRQSLKTSSCKEPKNVSCKSLISRCSSNHLMGKGQFVWRCNCHVLIQVFCRYLRCYLTLMYFYGLCILKNTYSTIQKAFAACKQVKKKKKKEKVIFFRTKF